MSLEGILVAVVGHSGISLLEKSAFSTMNAFQTSISPFRCIGDVFRIVFFIKKYLPFVEFC